MAARTARKVERLIAEARELVSNERFSKAASYYEKLIELEPEDGEWMRRAADCYWRLGDETKRKMFASQAANAYATGGHALKAIAMCKVVLSIDAQDGAMQQLLNQLCRPPQARARVKGNRRPQRTAATTATAGTSGSNPSEKKATDAKGSSLQAQRARGVKARARLAAATALKQIRARRAAQEDEALDLAKTKQVEKADARPGGAPEPNPGQDSPTRPDPAESAAAHAAASPLAESSSPKPKAVGRIQLTKVAPDPEAVPSAPPPPQSTPAAAPPASLPSPHSLIPLAPDLPPEIRDRAPSAAPAKRSQPALTSLSLASLIPSAKLPSQAPGGGTIYSLTMSQAPQADVIVPLIRTPPTATKLQSSEPSERQPEPMGPLFEELQDLQDLHQLEKLRRPADDGRLEGLQGHQQALQDLQGPTLIDSETFEDAPLSLDRSAFEDEPPRSDSLPQSPSVPPLEEPPAVGASHDSDDEQFLDDDSPDPPSVDPLSSGGFENIPLLSHLSDEALHRLIQRVDLIELLPGDLLFRQGDIADAMFVLVQGEISIAIYEGQQEIELGSVEEGEFFGEIGLLSDQPRQATALAAEPSRLLRFNRDAVAALVQDDPEALRVLLRFLRESLVDNLMLTSELFSPFDEAERKRLMDRFEFLEIEQGSLLIQRGQRPGGFYVLLSGEVISEQRGRLRRLGPGATFGGPELLQGGPAKTDVLASSKCFALFLSESSFRELIMTHPMVLEVIASQQDPVSGGPEAWNHHLTLF